MKATDLITHGCTPSIAAGAIAALNKQSTGKPLSEFEQGLITMATPAMTAYRRAGLMWITQNPRFGQLYIEHNGLEYRVLKQKVAAFLAAIDLAEHCHQRSHHWRPWFPPRSSPLHQWTVQASPCLAECAC